MLLLLEVVRAAAAEGLEAVQLFGGIEPWTSMWTEDVDECATVAAYPPGPGSLSAALGRIGAAAQSRAEGVAAADEVLRRPAQGGATLHG